ncbi:MAG: histidinol-phosphatase HisJ family protein [Lachnospiraceae bacterium]|nr:histidinol-phosphatase HisJ family protein [Lachnospiraceae bacterium]
MLWDTHIHTAYSGDSSADPDEMIKKSIDLGLDGICITDHLDLDFPETPGFEPLDPEAYAAGICRARESYRETFPVGFGIEIGLQPHLADAHREFLDTYDFDFVIGSSHAVHGKDPYYPPFFEGRTQQEAYQEYFESIVENILAFDDFDVFGHIDYVVRYGPEKNENYSYEEYREILDVILKLLVDRGKGIEINTAGFKYGLGHPNPTEEIIKQYRELGGEIVTIGSDAHSPEQIAYAFEKVPDILKDCGFQYYTVFQGRKPEFIKL